MHMYLVLKQFDSVADISSFQHLDCAVGCIFIHIFFQPWILRSAQCLPHQASVLRSFSIHNLLQSCFHFLSCFLLDCLNNLFLNCFCDLLFNCLGNFFLHCFCDLFFHCLADLFFHCFCDLFFHCFVCDALLNFDSFFDYLFRDLFLNDLFNCFSFNHLCLHDILHNLLFDLFFHNLLFNSCHSCSCLDLLHDSFDFLYLGSSSCSD